MAGLGEIIPIIDLEEVPDEMLNKKIREASERWGSFRVINHGIPSFLMSEMKKTGKDLFNRPYEVKMRNRDVIPGRGYMAPSKSLPLFEAVSLYDLASSQVINTFCDQLDASSEQRFVYNIPLISTWFVFIMEH